MGWTHDFDTPSCYRIFLYSCSQNLTIVPLNMEEVMNFDQFVENSLKSAYFTTEHDMTICKNRKDPGSAKLLAPFLPADKYVLYTCLVTRMFNLCCYESFIDKSYPISFLWELKDQISPNRIPNIISHTFKICMYFRYSMFMSKRYIHHE